MRVLGFGLCLILVLVVVLMRGCSSMPDPWENHPGSPRVVVTIPPLYSFVRAVGGKDTAIQCLCTHTGPHQFNLDLSRGALLTRADLFFSVGLTLDDHFADKLAQNSRSALLRHIKLGPSLSDPNKKQLIPLPKPVQHGDHTHTGHDPHLWMGIDIACDLVAQIRDDFIKLQQSRRSEFTKNAADYIGKLKELESEYRQAFEKKKNRRLLTFHDSLRYLARNFNLEIMGILEEGAGDEPTSAHLASLEALCVQAKKEGKPIAVLAVEPQYPRDTSAKILTRSLKGKHGIDLILTEIDPLETANLEELVQEGSDWYLSRMRANLQALLRDLP